MKYQRFLAEQASASWRCLISRCYRELKLQDHTMPYSSVKSRVAVISERTFSAPGSITRASSSGQTAQSAISQSSVTVPAPALIQQVGPNAQNPSNQGVTSTNAAMGRARSSSPKRPGLYILFCTVQGLQLRHSQIEVAKCENDDVFFQRLRLEFKRMRGFWRYWLDPQQFSHCEFVKFTRFYVDELTTVGRDLPQSPRYEYQPRPPGPHDDPPITPHEFRVRFYRLRNTCGCKEALARIPKRVERFQVNLHVGGPEHMWGLQAELRTSALRVVVWQVVITAGGWVFMGWWLSRHSGDLQNAVVPVTLIVSVFMLLWLPLNQRFKAT